MDADRLLADLNRWAADRRADAAAAARARERSLRQQAAETATLAGVLVDLAERRAAVVVRTSSGIVHRGRLVAVGQDFAALTGDGDRAPATFVATAALVSVRPVDGPAAAATGDRAPSDLDLGSVLAGAAVERPRVRVAVGVEQVVGELLAAGLDVVTVRTDGDPPAVVYVPLASVSEVSLG